MHIVTMGPVYVLYTRRTARHFWQAYLWCPLADYATERERWPLLMRQQLGCRGWEDSQFAVKQYGPEDTMPVPEGRLSLAVVTPDALA